ncbi:hypothetical protein Emin_0826 [Elusimicrobium minutum Pei191]|uniref:Uncharacterized protein n=1 Tax=Elusimicrobium minutum (strain Pei191) TaxID=445932 RepID=B2KCY5_ELUMP|nr:hypothetical protein [Elusimicrobium minutum]ACC98381.1 hypothetical protein Emin_0826 [Elusimicrobium minutum Pei191]
MMIKRIFISIILSLALLNNGVCLCFAQSAPLPTDEECIRLIREIEQKVNQLNIKRERGHKKGFATSVTGLFLMAGAHPVLLLSQQQALKKLHLSLNETKRAMTNIYNAEGSLLRISNDQTFRLHYYKNALNSLHQASETKNISKINLLLDEAINDFGEILILENKAQKPFFRESSEFLKYYDELHVIKAKTTNIAAYSNKAKMFSRAGSFIFIAGILYIMYETAATKTSFSLSDTDLEALNRDIAYLFQMGDELVLSAGLNQVKHDIKLMLNDYKNNPGEFYSYLNYISQNKENIPAASDTMRKKADDLKKQISEDLKK